MSPSIIVEALEQRTHLAATPLAAFYPLGPGSKWLYSVVEDGVKKSETYTILSKMGTIHGQSVFQRFRKESDGDSDIELDNFNAQRQIQFHATVNDQEQLVFG